MESRLFVAPGKHNKSIEKSGQHPKSLHSKCAVLKAENLLAIKYSRIRNSKKVHNSNYFVVLTGKFLRLKKLNILHTKKRSLKCIGELHLRGDDVLIAIGGKMANCELSKLMEYPPKRDGVDIHMVYD